jgi:hypothetical protein
MILDDMIANSLLPMEKRFVVRNALLLKHLHQVCLHRFLFFQINFILIFSMKKNFIDIYNLKK